MEEKKKRRTKGLRYWLALPLVVLCLSSAGAADTVPLGEVVVTATRYGEQSAVVPANVTVISNEDIQTSSARNIPDLLTTEAGIHVSDITGNKRSFTVDLRGFGEAASANTLVLVDGRRINEPDLSGVDWLDIPLERVERIEIIRGGRGGVLYGDNASGGVINIITKEGEGLRGSVGMTAGSYGTFSAASSAADSTRDFSLRVSGNYLTSDGYRDNSQTDSKDVGLNTAYYLRDFMKVQLSGGYHKDKTGLPGALKESDFAAGASRTDTIFPDDFSDTEDYYIKAAPEVYFGDSLFRIDTSFRKRTFQSFSSGDWGSFLGDSRIETTALSPQVVLKKDVGPVKNVLTAGVDYRKSDEDIVNDSLFFGTRSKGTFTLKKEDEGYYLHDDAAVTPALHLSGGYRYDKANFTFRPSSPEGLSMSRDLYTAGVNYAFLKKSYVYASYSRSFRYPLLDELYSFITNTINTALVPQTSDSYEAGVRYYFTDSASAQINCFRTDSDHEIIFNPLTFTNENLDGPTRRQGIEISYEAEATAWLTVRGSYTFTEATIKGGGFGGSRVPNVPRHKAAADLIARPAKGFTAGLNGVYVGERPFISDFPNDFSNQQGYLVLNAKFAYEWKSLKAFLDINNLTNKEYSEFGVIGGFPQEKAFYPSPKRNLLAGLSVNF